MLSAPVDRDGALRPAGLTGAWKINANGYKGQLALTKDPADGTRLVGRLLGDRVRGSYQASTMSLTLIREDDRGGAIQAYKGYLLTGPGADQAPCELAGTFQSFHATSEQSQRIEFGWYAVPAE